MKTIALAGNPNTGKTTIFNYLSNAKEKTGNWHGTTVELKESIVNINNEQFRIIDLPGIYNLAPHSLEEKVARDFLLEENPELIIVVIDASNMERGLSLITQLRELNKNILCIINMMDIAHNQGISIDLPLIEKIFDSKTIATIAQKNIGLNELKTIIPECAKKQPSNFIFSYGEHIANSISQISNILTNSTAHIDKPSTLGYALHILEDTRYSLIENFDVFTKQNLLSLKISLEEKIMQDFGEHIEMFISEKRYAFVKGIITECVNKKLSLEQKINYSDMIDRIVTHKVLGLPIFLLTMYLLFQMVFTFSAPFVQLIQLFFNLIETGLASMINVFHIPPIISSFLIKGVLHGVGSVAVFLPNILILFLGISVLEDTGYLARAGFIMDRFMHLFGLHGKSFIPLLLGFGCNVPAIMAARTLNSQKDRILTILIIPFMSCSARLPVYTLFTAAFFPKHQGLIVLSLYLIGILISIIAARILKNILFSEESSPLIIELPPYKIPRFKNMLIHTWIRVFSFIKKAGTIILPSVIILWILSSIPFGVIYASEYSVLGRIAKLFAPIFVPAGYGFWQAVVALGMGVIGKELVVGAFGTLIGIANTPLSMSISQYFTPLSAYSFLLMVLIYVPCVAVIATIKSELNWKYAILSLFCSTSLAWLVSVMFYQTAMLISHLI